MSKSNVSVVFWVIAAIALLWNLMGVLAFAGDFLITPEALDLLDEQTPGYKALYESNPGWLKLFYGIATIGGLLGAIFLLLRKKIALPLFIASLIAVLIQMGYSMFATNAREVLGTNSAVIMPIFVICISAFLVYYTRKGIANQWIN